MTAAAERSKKKGGGGAPPSENQQAEPVSGLPTNNDAVAKLVRECMGKLQECDQKAALVNAERKKIREELAAAGLNRHAVAFAKKLYEMDDTQRLAVALSLGISLAALDLPPVQTELQIDASGEPQVH